MKKRPQKEAEMINILRQDSFMRIYVLFAVYFVVTAFLIKTEPSKLIPLYIIITIAFWPCLLEYLAIKKRSFLDFALWTALTSDILMVTIGAHYTAHEILIFSIYMVAVLSTTVVTLKIGLYEAFLVAVFYPALLALEYFQIIPSRFTFAQGYFHHLYQVAPGISFSFLLAYMGGSLADHLKSEKKKAEILAKKVNFLYSKTKISSELIFENIGDGFLIINERGIIEKANKTASILLGIKKLIGRSIKSVGKVTESYLLQILADFKEVTKEIEIKAPEKRILELRVSPLILGKKKNLIVILRDVTPSWGIVYDSKTKRPVENTIVRIFDAEYHKVLETKVTDEEGRFEFLVKPGKYYLTATKEGYRFPSKVKENYHGEPISIEKKTKALINVRIPLDLI